MEFEQYELLIEELTPLNINQDLKVIFYLNLKMKKEEEFKLILIKFKMEFILKLIIKKLFSLKMIFKIFLFIINLIKG